VNVALYDSTVEHSVTSRWKGTASTLAAIDTVHASLKANVESGTSGEKRVEAPSLANIE
jgi:hypothetical protein